MTRAIRRQRDPLGAYLPESKSVKRWYSLLEATAETLCMPPYGCDPDIALSSMQSGKIVSVDPDIAIMLVALDLGRKSPDFAELAGEIQSATTACNAAVKEVREAREAQMEPFDPDALEYAKWYEQWLSLTSTLHVVESRCNAANARLVAAQTRVLDLIGKRRRGAVAGGRPDEP